MFRLILVIYLIKSLTDLSLAIRSGDFKKKIKDSFYYNNFIILDIVHNNKVDYKLFEIIIDFILLLRNLFREPIYYLKFFICYVLCFILFWYIPLIYFILYISNCVLIVVSISFCLLFGVKRIINFYMRYPSNNNKFELFKCIILIPYNYALSFIYFSLSLKKGKFNLSQIINNAFISSILMRPFWFFKILVKLTICFKNIIFSDIWLRKNIIVWPKIFINMLFNGILEIYSNSYWNFFFLINGKRIIIEKSHIRLNPNVPESKLIERLTISELKFSRFVVIKHKNQWHQSILRNDCNVGFNMTTSNRIRHNSGFIKTNGLISDYPKQRVIFSAYSKNYPNILQGRLNSFYYNNKLNEFNNFGGMLLRLNLTANHTISDNILFQLSPNNADVIKLEQKEKIINIKYEDRVVTEYKIGHEEYVDNGLLIELGKINNNELFKIYERNNNFDILMTKLEINHKNYKEVENF